MSGTPRSEGRRHRLLALALALGVEWPTASAALPLSATSAAPASPPSAAPISAATTGATGATGTATPAAPAPAPPTGTATATAATAAATARPDPLGPPPAGSAPGACPPAQTSSPLPLPAGPLLRPAPPAALAAGAISTPGRPAPDYRARLASTALGWPRLRHWCVWVEPSGGTGGPDRWQQLWADAVERALAHWQQLLPLQRVSDPGSAQVWIRRRRPPLVPGADGRLRASHGRATLSLLQVERNGQLRPEPRVEVLISPGQRPAAMQATALHELGHAFGLWGHSDDPLDAMAAVPGAEPVLQLSRRDRATLLWLYAQPTSFGVPAP